jgi:hypothetical protein
LNRGTVTEVTPLDATMMSLLDKPEVQTELGFEASELKQLQTINQFYNNLLSGSKDLWKAENRRELEKTQHLKKAELAELLGENRRLRLWQIKLQTVGAAAAFQSEVIPLLRITPQQQQYSKAMRESQDGLYQRFAKQPLEQEEQVAIERLQALYDQAQRELETQVMEKILTPEQKKHLTELRGKPFSHKIDLFPMKLLLSAFKKRLTKVIPKFQDVYSLFALAKVPLVQQKTGITVADADSLVPIHQEWEAFHEAIYQSIAKLETQAQLTELSRWGMKRVDKWREIDRKITAVLGQEKANRLRQIRVQLLGPGSLLGIDNRHVLNLSQEQEQRLLEVLKEDATRFLNDFKSMGKDGSKMDDPGGSLLLMQEETFKKIGSLLSKEQHKRLTGLWGPPLTLQEKRSIQNSLRKLAPPSGTP